MLNNYSGISYNISIPNGAIPYAQKITTVNDSDYNLIDAHRIDWNSSKLSYINFKLKYIENFFGVPNGTPQEERASKRLRYGDTPNYNSSGIPTTWPNWYEGGNYPTTINNTGELLDIIDYLSYSTNYLCEAVERLQDSFDKTKPVLKLLPDEIKALNGMIDTNSNNVLSDPIKFYLEPNQNNGDYVGTNKAYKEIIDRKFTLHTNVIDQTGNNITSDLQLFFKESQNGEEIYTDVFSIDGNGIFLRAYKPLMTVGGGALTGQYLTEYEVNGWKPLLRLEEIDPKIDYVNDAAYIQYSNYLLSTITAKTPPTSQHSPSDPLTIKVQIVKSTNKFDYVYINGVRYIYLERGFFKTTPKYNIINNVYCDYIISMNDLGHGIDLEKLNEEYFADNQYLYESLICVSSQLSNVTNLNYIKVSNNSDIEIKIFPRYFGDYSSGTNKGILPGAKDIKDSEDIISYAKYTLTQSKDNSLQNLNEVNKATITETITEVIDGKLRTGFKINFKMSVAGSKIDNVDSNNRTPENSAQGAVNLFICTTPTKYVGYNNIFLKFGVVKSYEVFLIDANREFNGASYDNYENQPTTYVTNKPIDTLSNFTNQGVLFSYIKREDKGEYTWDLGISIFNERSWMNNSKSLTGEAFRQKAEEIYNPTNLVTSTTPLSGTNLLPKTNSDVKILNGQAIINEDKFDFIGNENKGYSNQLPNENEYTQGFPNLLIGGQDYYYDDIIKLTYVYVRNYNNKYTPVNVSNNLEIDFAETYSANKDNFVNKLSVDDKKLITGDSDIELGKNLCFRYLGLIRDINPRDNRDQALRMIFFRPTIPSTLFDVNNDKKEWEDYSSRDDWFKLILKIDPTRASSNSSSSNINHDGIKITMRLLVTRAESKFSGWTHRQSSDGASVVNIMLFDDKEPVYKNTLVNSNAFLTNNQHCIQTRLNSNFTVTNDYPKIEPTAGADGYKIHSFTFTQQTGLNKVEKTLWIKQSNDRLALLPNDPAKSSEDKIEYKIDDDSEFQMQVFIKGNQWFRSIDNESILTKVYRTPNKHIVFTTKDKLIFNFSIQDKDTVINDEAHFVFNSKYSIGAFNYEYGVISAGTALYGVTLNNVTMTQLQEGFNLWNFFDNPTNFTDNLKSIYNIIGKTKDEKIVNIKDIVKTAVTLTYNDLSVSNSIDGINNNYMANVFRPSLKDYNSFELITNKDSYYNRFYTTGDTTDDIDKYVQIVEETANNGSGKDGLILRLTNAAKNAIGASKFLCLTLQIMFPMINNTRGYILDLRISINIKD